TKGKVVRESRWDVSQVLAHHFELLRRTGGPRPAQDEGPERRETIDISGRPGDSSRQGERRLAQDIESPKTIDSQGVTQAESPRGDADRTVAGILERDADSAAGSAAGLGQGAGIEEGAARGGAAAVVDRGIAEEGEAGPRRVVEGGAA